MPSRQTGTISWEGRGQTKRGSDTIKPNWGLPSTLWTSPHGPTLTLEIVPIPMASQRTWGR